jgi:hypothetical protein
MVASILEDSIEAYLTQERTETYVIAQRICHLLIEKGKCHPYERRGDIEQQGTATLTGDQ